MVENSGKRPRWARINIVSRSNSCGQEQAQMENIKVRPYPHPGGKELREGDLLHLLIKLLFFFHEKHMTFPLWLMFPVFNW